MAKKAKKRPFRGWSKEDVKTLRVLAKARMSAPHIARRLKRTPGAVSQKGFALGVRFRSVKRSVE